MATLQGNYTAEEMAPVKKALNSMGVDTSGAPALNGPTAGTIAETQQKNFDQTERDRYRSLGEAAANREAYRVDFGAAQGDRMNGLYAREGQGDALAMQRGAALGNAPSRAAIMGAQAGGQSLEAALGASAGAKTFGSRSGPGMAAAQMAAMQGQGGMQLGAQQQAMGMRSGEMNQARGAYAAGATGMRAGDYTAMGLSQQQAEAQAQAEIAQRHLNQQGQMGYEQMGINREQQQTDEQLRRMQIEAQKRGGDASVAQAALDRNRADAIAAGSMGLGVISGASRSDERTKGAVVPLYEDPASGVERHWDADVAPAAARAPQGASLSGPTPKYAAPSLASAAAAKAGGKPATRKYTDAELNALADKMLGAQAVQHRATLETGATVRDPMTNALADGLKPYQYEYKPEFAGAEGQQQGEKNVGPMAQDMASNPITGQAVSTGPDGLLQIDMKKATKLSLAAAGHNAQKIRELEAKMKGGR